ncbi:MAG: hypothetical protein J7647_10405 [Cyanobacteria bacterium SBLK]|nr:hypothetical protein [Cyanobacteria bacterium SBLK]
MNTTLTQAPQTAQRTSKNEGKIVGKIVDLNDERRALAAQVATRDFCHNTTFTAADIEAVTIRGGMVDIYFTNGGKTMVDIATFKEWVKEFKSESQLSDEQQEIIEAAIDAPFQAEVNFQDAIASFYSDEDGFMGTVRRDRFVWMATTETTATVHRTAEQAVQSLITCTYAEWEEAKAGIEGIRYDGNGYWVYGRGRVNTNNLLDLLHLSKTDRQIAILEQQIMIAD